MSYAEHGSRIFLAGRFNSNPLSRYGEFVVPRKRSEGRLKLFDSCSDLRAWSPNAQDNCRYFREIVENRSPSGRIIPYDVVIENLILLGQSELASVRRQLEKYKSLRLTPEQEQQLRNDDEGSIVRIKSDDFPLVQSQTVEGGSGILNCLGTPIQSICSSSSNFQDIEIDNDSSMDNSERSKQVFITSGTNEDVDPIDERTRLEDKSTKRYRTLEHNDHQELIIEKDSEIIVLKNELGVKEAELEEMRHIRQNLEFSLNEKLSLLDDLKRSLHACKEEVLGITKQLHQRNEECRKEHVSKVVVDRLKSSLVEKTHECSAHSQEIQNLYACLKETETIHKERDSLAKKLDEMKLVLRERDDLIKLNEKQAISLRDQEDEINRLLEFHKRESAKYMRMKTKLNDLVFELQAKDDLISQFDMQNFKLKPDVSPTGSLSEMPTVVIQNFKQSLQEDLQALQNELMKRQEFHEDADSRQDEPLRLKMKVDRMIETTLQHTNWERNKESMECSIEELTMEVAAPNAANDEQEAINESMVWYSKSGEKIKGLIHALEPYVKERSSLHEKIKYLNEALERARRASDSRDLTKYKQYLSDLMNNHRKECDVYAKKVESLKNKLEESRKKCTKLSERIRSDENDEMDEKIGEALAMHCKWSIQKMTKLSDGLRGAGDEFGKEMAKTRDELEVRNAEIAKLREQVASHASRGQGDQANNENLDVIARLRNEKKLLVEESMMNHESLRTTKNELQSYQFKLIALKQRIKDFSTQLKQKDQEIQLKGQQIERLEKENEGLNKTVLITNDLAMEGDEMNLKLESLQEENAKLIDQNVRVNRRCADYENRLGELTDKELHAKEAFDHAAFQWQELILKKDREYEVLRKEHDSVVKELRASNVKVEKLTEEMKSLRKNSKKLDLIENWTAEISRLDEDRKRLNDNVANLRNQLEYHHRLNGKLEEDLQWKLNENEIMQNAIRELRENIQRDGISEDTAKRLLQDLPNKICEHIETLQKQMNSSETEGHSWQREIDQWKTQSLKASFIIEELRNEIISYRIKTDEQDKQIVILEKANMDLKKTLEESLMKDNSLRTDGSLTNLPNEIVTKDIIITKLNHDISAQNEELKNLAEQIESLIKEKNELADALKKEKDSRQTTLKILQQKYNAQMRDYQDRHNESIKTLESKYNEHMNNTSNPFDSETWLQSLTMKEMAELHNRICASSPCGTAGEVLKTRALNDKQNQQLQQDDKLLHTDKLHLKIGHDNDEAIGIPYMYERRKFDDAKQNSIERQLKDNTFDTQRMNLVHQCAIRHKHDSSH